MINGNVMIWYIAVPLTYLEAGLTCSPKSLYASLSDGYLLAFVMVYMYVLMPLIARIGSVFLTYARVNPWLLKGMEVRNSRVFNSFIYGRIFKNVDFLKFTEHSFQDFYYKNRTFVCIFR